MTPPKITIDTPPPSVETSNEGHSAAATVTAAAGGSRLENPDVVDRVDHSDAFGVEVSKFAGIFYELDRMFQAHPTTPEDFRGPIQRFAERAGDAVAQFTERLNRDFALGPVDMDQDGPYYRILADWAFCTKAIDQELYADIAHINGREMKLPGFSLGTSNDDPDADINPDTGDDTVIG